MHTVAAAKKGSRVATLKHVLKTNRTDSTTERKKERERERERVCLCVWERCDKYATAREQIHLSIHPSIHPSFHSAPTLSILCEVVRWFLLTILVLLSFLCRDEMGRS